MRQWTWFMKGKTCLLVATDSNGILVNVPSAIFKFRGHHIDQLREWAKRKGLQEVKTV